MGRWLDTLNPATEDVLDTWDQFITQFEASFDDTQKVQKARSQLDRLTMKWPEVDQYTMDFEKLTREANYQIGSPESTQMYLKGLPDDVAADVLGPPFVHTYNALKERAAQSVSTRQTLRALRDSKRNRPAHSGEWQKFERRPRNNRPQNQFNLPNAPRADKNTQVPMDLSRIQGNKGQGPRRFQNYAASTAPPTKGNCFKCGQHGHFARNCPQERRKTRTNAVQNWRANNGQPPIKEQEGHEENKPSRVKTAVAAFTILSQEEKSTLASTIGGKEAKEKNLSRSLINSAFIRALSSERVFLSNRQSMSIRVYIHTANKRVETPALLDSGATENFINHRYATHMRLPVKKLPNPRKVFNVDGTLNKKGDIQFYTDLEVKTGQKNTNMRFFLTDLGSQRMILGYPWFAAVQPKIDWAKGWINYTQLPVVIKTTNARKTQFARAVKTCGRRMKLRMATQTKASQLAEQNQSKITPQLPDEYRRHAQVFSEQKAQRFPESRPWDHAIKLKKDPPSTLPGKIYSLTQSKQKALQEFIKEHLQKGYIRPSKSPYAAPFFYIKKKDGKLRPVQDYRRINEWTIKNCYPLPLIPELINRVKGAALFSKFDVRWGYNNVRIKKGRRMESGFHHQPRPIQTQGYVLWTNELPGDLPNHDE